MNTKAAKVLATRFDVAIINSDGTPGGYEKVDGYRLGAVAVHPLTDNSFGIYHFKTGIQIFRVEDVKLALYLAHVLDQNIDWRGVRRGFNSASPAGFTPELAERIAAVCAEHSKSMPEIQVGLPSSLDSNQFPIIDFEIAVSGESPGDPPRYHVAKGHKVGALAAHSFPSRVNGEGWRVSHIAAGMKVMDADDKQVALWIAQVADQAVDWCQVKRGPDIAKPIGFTPDLIDKIWAALEKNGSLNPHLMN